MKTAITPRIAKVALVVLFAAAGVSFSLSAAGAAEPAANQLSDEQKSQGWRLLFDGQQPEKHWRGYRRDAYPEGWRAEDGWLVLADSGTGDIITRDKFGAFELYFEWRVADGSNSGVFYRVQELDGRIWKSAPEYQIIDNAAGPDPKHAAGALYDLIGADPSLAKPAGEVNSARIIVKGDYIEHHLNGKKVFGVHIDNEEWAEMVRVSKFEIPPFATAERGHLGLQDHGDWVAYRNIRIRSLDQTDQ